MNRFEKENLIKHILDEIKKNDEFVNAFYDELTQALYPVIGTFYPHVSPGTTIDEVLQNYALVITNYTESVIDKDRTYPLYRLNDELDAMNRLVAKLTFSNPAFTDTVSFYVKELMIKHFPNIYNLSGNGFRLLELNARLYVWEFNANLANALG
jgi:hypothetical protein